MKSVEEMLRDLVKHDERLTVDERALVLKCKQLVEKYHSTMCLTDDRAETLDELWHTHVGRQPMR